MRKKHGKRYFSYEVEIGKFDWRLKEEEIDKEEKLDGKFIVKTKEKDLLTGEIVRGYKDLMEVEGTFKKLKDFLGIMPIYHYTDRRVRAHIFVCILSLFIQKYLEQKLEKADIDISVEKAIRLLKKIRVVINQVGELTLKYVLPPNKEMERILRAVGIMELPKILSDITPIKTKNNEETIK